MWWRPEPRGPYVPFTAADLQALESRFAEHGRTIDRP
jgi:hypothetical protein